MHTAVKISPEYEQGVVHVLDASRSVTVAGNLLNREQKAGFIKNVQTEYRKLKEDFSNKKTAKSYLKFTEAQKNGVPINWSRFSPVIPTFTGTKALLLTICRNWFLTSTGSRFYCLGAAR